MDQKKLAAPAPAFTPSLQDYSRRYHKQAGEKRADPTKGEPTHVWGPDVTNREALLKLLGLGITTTGIGAGVRGLMGLKDMFKAPAYSPKIGPRPTVLQIRVPKTEEEEEEELARRRRPLLKFSEGPADVKPEDTLWNWLRGRQHDEMIDKPWFLTGAMAAGAGGLYGGWKGMDKLIASRTKNKADEELRNVKREYRRALIDQQIAEAGGSKLATINEDLDKVYELVKTAQDPIVMPGPDSIIHNWKGRLASAYLPIAALLATGTGMGMYNYAKSRSTGDRLAKAIEQRERLRWAARPPEIYAVTKPTSMRMQGNKKTKDEEADTKEASSTKAAAEKVASFYKPSCR